jgi:hypothetical protein
MIAVFTFVVLILMFFVGLVLVIVAPITGEKKYYWGFVPLVVSAILIKGSF